MRFRDWVVFTFVFTYAALAQNSPIPRPASESKSVTVPITLDHDRVVIDIDLRLPDGSSKRVKGWVDNGTSDLWMSQRVAAWMGLSVNCDGQVCSGMANPQLVSLEVLIGGMKIFLPAIDKIKVPAGVSSLAPGMNAEINIPSPVLRNYDVLINFPGRTFTIAQPGNLKFNGVKEKVMVDAENGMVQVPSQIENKKYNLVLNLGSPISFLPEDLFDKLAVAHADWPRMTGAVGPANELGTPEETKLKLMRVARLQFGPLFLTKVAVGESSPDRIAELKKRAAATVGMLGASALLNYRVGIDYAHSTVYFDIGRLFNFPDFDVIGVILRPEDGGRFSIAGVADFEGKPSLPQGAEGIQIGDYLIAVDGIPVLGATLGQVWSMLGGEPGKQRTLTILRGDKQLSVAATVEHFMGETAGDAETEEKK